MICRTHGVTGGDIGLKKVETKNQAGQVKVRYVHTGVHAFDDCARITGAEDLVKYCPTGALALLP
jgi:hypothetical protein